MINLLRFLFAKPSSAVGVSILFFFILLTLFGSWIAPYKSNEQRAQDARQPPSAQHWFGTDHLGRDVFSRVVLGAGEIIGLAGSATLLAVFGGILFGLISGYRGGWLDEILMRIFDSILALPAMLLALLFLGIWGTSHFSVLIVIAVAFTPIVARVVRSVTLSVKSKGFIEIAQTQGESPWWILGKEIFPFILPALSVETAVRFSYAIFLTASLGFLGVGIQPPNPNWGLMIREARDYGQQLPWTLYFPTIAIILLVIAVNLSADGIKEYSLERER